MYSAGRGLGIAPKEAGSGGAAPRFVLLTDLFRDSTRPVAAAT